LVTCALQRPVYAQAWKTSPNAQAIITARPAVAPALVNIDLRYLPNISAPLKVSPLPVLRPLPGMKTPVPGAVTTESAGPPSYGSSGAGTLTPDPGANFDGLFYSQPIQGGMAGAGYPPDTNGDVGPNHFVEGVNTSFAVYDKSGNLMTAATFDALWSGAGTGTPCDNSNGGDPTIGYDQLGGRWFVADLGFRFSGGMPVAPFYECIAVSQTSDPVAGGWYLYPIQADTDIRAGQLNDYPKMGFWPDGLYISSNEFAFPGGNYRGVRLWALNRTDMEAGMPVRVLTADLGTNYFGLLPANQRGPILPALGTPEYFVSEDEFFYAFDVFNFSVNWDTMTGILTGPTLVSQTSYGPPFDPFTFDTNIVPQPDTSTMLDTVDDRLMQQAQYRNNGNAESIYVTHNVRPTGQLMGPVGMQWAQLDVTSGLIATSPVQQQIYVPGSSDGTYRWMGSLAVDGSGDLLLGYSASSPSVYPSIRYNGRLFTDPPNDLPQGENTLIAGTGSQVVNCGPGPCHRWGDYSAMTIDPTNDCTFWYANEYYAATGGNWQTRIGSIIFPGCSVPVGTVQAAVTDCSLGTPIANAQITIDGTLYGVTQTDGTSATMLSPGSHSLSVSDLQGTVSSSFLIDAGATTGVAVCLASSQ
jgi:hypothetical protein